MEYYQVELEQALVRATIQVARVRATLREVADERDDLRKQLAEVLEDKIDSDGDSAVTP